MIFTEIASATIIIAPPTATLLMLQSGGADTFTLSSGTAAAVIIGIIGKLFWDKLDGINKNVSSIKHDLTHRMDRLEDRMNGAEFGYSLEAGKNEDQ